MIPTHTKKPTPVVAYKFTGFTNGSPEYVDSFNYDMNNTICDKCNHHFDDHGEIKTNSGNAIVCPGNYIVNNPDFPDDFYPVSAEIFESTYDVIEESTSTGSVSCSNDYLKLDAARILLDHQSGNKVAKKYLESLINEKSN